MFYLLYSDITESLVPEINLKSFYSTVLTISQSAFTTVHFPSVLLFHGRIIC